MHVVVRDNNVDQALKALKKKMQREGIFREMKLRGHFEKRFEDQAECFRTKLADFYGQSKAGSVRYAEAFEICEYGRHPDKEELKKLFPFFGE